MISNKYSDWFALRADGALQHSLVITFKWDLYYIQDRRSFWEVLYNAFNTLVVAEIEVHRGRFPSHHAISFISPSCYRAWENLQYQEMLYESAYVIDAASACHSSDQPAIHCGACVSVRLLCYRLTWGRPVFPNSGVWRLCPQRIIYTGVLALCWSLKVMPEDAKSPGKPSLCEGARVLCAFIHQLLPCCFVLKTGGYVDALHLSVSLKRGMFRLGKSWENEQ